MREFWDLASPYNVLEERKTEQAKPQPLPNPRFYLSKGANIMNQSCTVYDIYSRPEYSVILFACGARVFYQFIEGHLPLPLAPFIDTMIDDAGPLAQGDCRAPCPHQTGFAHNISSWCVKQRDRIKTPSWLVMRVDLNRMITSQGYVSAREVRLTKQMPPQQAEAVWPSMPPILNEVDCPLNCSVFDGSQEDGGFTSYPGNSHTESQGQGILLSGSPLRKERDRELYGTPSSTAQPFPPTPTNSAAATEEYSHKPQFHQILGHAPLPSMGTVPHDVHAASLRLVEQSLETETCTPLDTIHPRSASDRPDSKRKKKNSRKRPIVEDEPLRQRFAKQLNNPTRTILPYPPPEINQAEPHQRETHQAEMHQAEMHQVEMYQAPNAENWGWPSV
ncbi:hypothetical protein AUP68_02510 [Ilyonectria robusta]